MFTAYVNPRMTKNEIRDGLLDMATDAGQLLSKAKADKLANKFKKGLFDPELHKVLAYSDPTGEQATSRVWREQIFA